jgi:hypothetical protein
MDGNLYFLAVNTDAQQDLSIFSPYSLQGVFSRSIPILTYRFLRVTMPQPLSRRDGPHRKRPHHAPPIRPHPAGPRVPRDRRRRRRADRQADADLPPDVRSPDRRRDRWPAGAPGRRPYYRAGQRHAAGGDLPVEVPGVRGPSSGWAAPWRSRTPRTGRSSPVAPASSRSAPCGCCAICCGARAWRSGGNVSGG